MSSTDVSKPSVCGHGLVPTPRCPTALIRVWGHEDPRPGAAEKTLLLDPRKCLRSCWPQRMGGSLALAGAPPTAGLRSRSLRGTSSRAAAASRWVSVGHCVPCPPDGQLLPGNRSVTVFLQFPNSLPVKVLHPKYQINNPPESLAA